MSAPGNTGRRAGRKRPRYATHEEQLRELVAHMRRCDRQLARAIVTMLSAAPATLGAFGTVLAFVEGEARRGGGVQ